MLHAVRGSCAFDRSLSAAVLDDGAHHVLSTFGREAGITLDAHSVLPVAAEVSQPQSLRTGPNGQPPESSQLAQWYRVRTEHARGSRKKMIVALARKLLIALWHFARDGVVPEGVLLRPAH